MTKKAIKDILLSLVSVWISYVFIFSLFFKFTGHPETQNIFGTISEWMSTTINWSLGAVFTTYWAYVIWIAELIISLMLLFNVFLIIKSYITKNEANYKFSALWGLGAFGVMLGAIFFHTMTPLGIEVNGDGGSLFRAAVTICVLWLIIFITNFKSIKK